jgi:hypothetical protein
MGCRRSWPGVDFCDGAVHVKGLVFLIGQKQGFSPGGVTSGLRRIQMEGWRDQGPPFAGLKCGLRRASPRPAPAMELLWWPGPAASPWHGVLGNSCVFWLLALLTLWHGWGGGCVCGGGGGQMLAHPAVEWNCSGAGGDVHVAALQTCMHERRDQVECRAHLLCADTPNLMSQSTHARPMNVVTCSACVLTFKRV